MKEIDVSTDVETDGPIPGPHSMLGSGSAAYQSDKTLVATFSANLELLPGAAGDPDTMNLQHARRVPGLKRKSLFQTPARRPAGAPGRLRCYR